MRDRAPITRRPWDRRAQLSALPLPSPRGLGGGFLGEDNTLKTAGPLIPSPALANPLSLLSQQGDVGAVLALPLRSTILGCHFPSLQKGLLHALLSYVSISVSVLRAPGYMAVWACSGLPHQTQLVRLSAAQLLHPRSSSKIGSWHHLQPSGSAGYVIYRAQCNMQMPASC